MNRLAGATSPYLLQHADNPVDWWPWSDEAFAEAARRDVLVLLSVGYAACHWCHVMAHESFEDPQTAALVNENVVAIKVDREERPDVDSVYMTATQLMTGQGGWPMTVLMTPGREPLFCATYLPRQQFQQLIVSAAQAWRQQRAKVAEHAKQVTAAIAGNMDAAARAMRAPALAVAGTSAWHEVADQAVDRLASAYDAANGGFGDAPKFPPSMVLSFLLRHYQRTSSAAALSMVTGTLEAMARGGMYDQLGGGFARYCVDATWTVPHFEKMLYDNALLAQVYAHHWRLTGSPQSERIAVETCDWMLRELQTGAGGFAASLDADTEGSEGKYYVWTPAELASVLGADDAEFAASVFGVTPAGTFEHGASVLRLPSDPADGARFARVRAALLAARFARTRPGRDDKVVAAWNGLAIAALAECGVLFRRRDFVAAAAGAAALLAAVHIGDGRVTRTSRDGVPGGTPGALDDYACVAGGLLSLSGAAAGGARWVRLAGEILDAAEALFSGEKGGYYDAPADGEKLIFRPADPMDNATPSGTFALAGAMLSYAALTGSSRHRAAAEAALGVLPAIAARYPRAAGSGLSVAEALIAGPAEIAVVGAPDDPSTAELHWTALHAAPPGAVVAVGTGSGDDGIGLLAGRTLVNGGPAAYACRDFTCLAPVTTPAELRAQLTSRR